MFIRRWNSIFFSNKEAYILLGGELTNKILLEQGVPQGDVVSPYIFILAVEILLIKINHTKNIKGITYAKKESRSETLLMIPVSSYKGIRSILESVCQS